MSSRKEQKEALRREREERERAAKEAERRRRLIGYGAGGALALAAVVVLVLVLLGGGGDDTKGGGNPEILPSGGEAPNQERDDLDAAAKAAGCQLKSFRVPLPKEGFHVADINAIIKWETNPPAAGKHYQEPAEDGAYTEAPPDSTLVHTLEHGRIIVWFKPSLPRDDRANLKALFDEDDYHMVLVPRRNMDPAVAVTAWGAEPTSATVGGTGYVMTCPRFNDGIFDAIRSFKDEHRDNGPEVVP